MKRLMHRVLIVFSLISAFFLLAWVSSPAFAEVTYGTGYYLNLCGTGTEATADTCNGGCDPSKGSCTSDKKHAVKYSCDGKLTECREHESEFALTQSMGQAECGKTIQIDLFDKACRTLGFWTCNETNLKDYMVWYSGDCRAVTPTPTPSPSLPTPIYTSSCDDLEIVSGNLAYIPATVTLRARATDTGGSIERYRFYFGDGSQEETTRAEIQHRYESSGTFSTRVDIQDSRGVWKTSSLCRRTVSVKSLPLETHKSDCGNLFVTRGNETQAPATVEMTVTGYDNKGALKKFKLDFGDGKSEEKSQPDFSHRYDTPGTYETKGYIQDSEGSWKGGAGSCAETVYIQTQTLTSQPPTGTSTSLTLVALASGFLGFLGLFMKKSLSYRA
ncbi:MAG: PKD domain-containing protein [bacterium]|nr:PKD domain-containing protein [bacterium]